MSAGRDCLPGLRRAGTIPAPIERQRHPDERAEDQNGEPQMQRQPVLTHIDAFGKAGAHHVPADRALQGAQSEDAGEPGSQCTRDASCGEEIEKGQQKDCADEPAEEAMRPFPPEDDLEGLEAHAAIDVLVLGDLPIPGEGFEPVRLRQRGQRAADRLPFRDG